MTKTQKRNLAHFQAASEIQENEIIGIRKAYNAMALAACTRDDKRSADYREYVDQLEKLFGAKSLRVSDKQAAKGLAWLKNLQWTPKGKKRSTAPMTTWQEKAVLSFDHFEFVGMHEDSNGYRSFFTPAYKVVGKDASFTYAARCWQSGGVPFQVL